MKYHLKDEYMVNPSEGEEASLEETAFVYKPYHWRPQGYMRIARYWWKEPPDELLWEAA